MTPPRRDPLVLSCPRIGKREVSHVVARPGAGSRRATQGATPAGAYEPAVLRVREEFRALPGLSLTWEQARLVFDLDPHMCQAILDALVAEGFLARTSYGAFRQPR